MKPPPATTAPAGFGAVPDAVCEIVALLRANGHAAYLVGGCVRDLMLGGSAHDFDIATSASPDCVLSLLPRAVPIGLRHGTVMVPTRARPVDVTSFRAGPDIRADLAHRDFTINAMAYDPLDEGFLDPFGGRGDLAERRLRAVGAAAERFREDPLRMLRAARLAASLELAIDPELESAMAQLRAELANVARERIRSEIQRMLVAPAAARGIALLRRTGIEDDLLPGSASDAIAVVDALPPGLELRLAGWLRGANAEQILRQLRFPRRITAQVGHLLRQHPIGADLNPKRDAAVRKLIKKAGPQNLDALCALRECEIAADADADAATAALAKLRSVQAAIERVQHAGALALRRFDLALSGREVMDLLACGPGRRVGQALRYLTDQVIEDPACNTPERLRVLLERWAAEDR